LTFSLGAIQKKVAKEHAMDQPVVESTSNLALILPAILAATVAVGYALNSVLRDKGLGIFGNGAVMMVGMALGVFFMGLVRSYL